MDFEKIKQEHRIHIEKQNLITELEKLEHQYNEESLAITKLQEEFYKSEIFHNQFEIKKSELLRFFRGKFEENGFIVEDKSEYIFYASCEPFYVSLKNHDSESKAIVYRDKSYLMFIILISINSLFWNSYQPVRTTSFDVEPNQEKDVAKLKEKIEITNNNLLKKIQLKEDLLQFDKLEVSFQIYDDHFDELLEETTITEEVINYIINRK